MPALIQKSVGWVADEIALRSPQHWVGHPPSSAFHQAENRETPTEATNIL
ncbi:MAG: hypothetical protein HC778_02650 [Chamaesiphon sp. CSU_1_12]|nr:hypothetical protein [Chamaesiphon sp. CSU_1_12]